MGDVIEACAKKSQKFARRTALRAFLAFKGHRGCIDSRDYPTLELCEQLLDRVCESWTKRHICSSVAIKVWQQYFVAKHKDPQEVVERLSKWMPLWCDRTTPSMLVKVLTSHGWALFDG